MCSVCGVCIMPVGVCVYSIQSGITVCVCVVCWCMCSVCGVCIMPVGVCVQYTVWYYSVCLCCMLVYV